MADTGESDTTVEVTVRRRLIWRKWILPLLLIFGMALLALWVQRKDIADNVIGGYLRSHHVRATYRIDSIGGAHQVLSHIVVGDPKKPDLTIERADVVIRYRLGLPAISRIVLTRPRLYGTYLGGKLSFGELDRLLFSGKKQPFELPDFSLDLDDGRALLETDYGAVGLKAEGEGNLRDGFAGMLAATAPKLAVGDCDLAGATAYGEVTIDGGQPGFDGPLRLDSLDCGHGSVQLLKTHVGMVLRADRGLAGAQGKLSGDTRAARFADAAAEALRLQGDVTYRNGELTAGYDLTADGLAHPQARLASFRATGTVRAAGRGLTRLRLDSDFSGTGFHPGAGFDRALAHLAEGSADNLVGAVLRKLRGALLREANGSRFMGEASLRRTGDALSLVIPQASLQGGSGEKVLSLSRFQYGGGGGGLPRLSGNFATGGRDLPRIEGHLTQRAGKGFTARLAMATYAAEGGSVAVPSLAIVSNGNGLGFSGAAILSGDLPGGHAEGLLLPLSGNWSRAAGLALWRQCTRLTFDSLRYANLTIERHGLLVCPAKGQPVVRYGDAGLKVAAGVPSLDLAGHLGTTPIAIRSGPIGFAYPGTLSARQLLVTLGPGETATTFAVEDLTARIGKTVSGRFDGTQVKLASVPFDILGAQGTWDYADGRFAVSDGAFHLADRQQPARFQPLVARGATLALKDNLIAAEAVMREPASDREIVRVALRHDLASGSGHADLAVPGIVFDNRLQPQPPVSECLGRGGKTKDPPGLTCLALGVINSVKGTVTGTGRVDWDEKGVSSSGRFSSDALDFAAAFGPVKGASGTIVFTDLLGLTTAPGQILKVASVNPGIEVTGGEVAFHLTNGQALSVERGTWPFMGGTLTMRPVTLNLGVSERRDYVLEIRGLEAAQFVEHMQLENLSATGTFDGEIPVIFDGDGNGRIEGGHLVSRDGGNVSYVGALTYKDLSTMANMAFDALRSLDYKGMAIDMNGPLTGEIVTRVRFDGVSQGAGAKQNFLTRQIGRLPFRFVVTVTAPFYQVISNIKAMYDPAMIRSPQDLAAEGKLIDESGHLVDPGQLPATPGPISQPTPDEANIQRRESENAR